MPCPSPLHDPMSKLLFPNAPLPGQLRAAAREKKEPDANGYHWGYLMDASADKIDALEEEKLTGDSSPKTLLQELKFSIKHARRASVIAQNTDGKAAFRILYQHCDKIIEELTQAIQAEEERLASPNSEP